MTVTPFLQRALPLNLRVSLTNLIFTRVTYPYKSATILKPLVHLIVVFLPPLTFCVWYKL